MDERLLKEYHLTINLENLGALTGWAGVLLIVAVLFVVFGEHSHVYKIILISPVILEGAASVSYLRKADTGKRFLGITFFILAYANLMLAVSMTFWNVEENVLSWIIVFAGMEVLYFLLLVLFYRIAFYIQIKSKKRKTKNASVNQGVIYLAAALAFFGAQYFFSDNMTIILFFALFLILLYCGAYCLLEYEKYTGSQKSLVQQ